MLVSLVTKGFPLCENKIKTASATVSHHGDSPQFHYYAELSRMSSGKFHDIRSPYIILQPQRRSDSAPLWTYPAVPHHIGCERPMGTGGLESEGCHLSEASLYIQTPPTGANCSQQKSRGNVDFLGMSDYS